MAGARASPGRDRLDGPRPPRARLAQPAARGPDAGRQRRARHRDRRGPHRRCCSRSRRCATQPGARAGRRTSRSPRSRSRRPCSTWRPAVRGYVVSGDERFLVPYDGARSRAAAADRRPSESSSQHDPAQQARARHLVTPDPRLRHDYTDPSSTSLKDNPRAAARLGSRNEKGRRYVDGIREHFRQFSAAEDAIAARSAETASERADLAIGARRARAGPLAALIVLLFGVYLARSIARPVRDVAIGASRLAARRAVAAARRGRPRRGRRADPLLQLDGRAARARPDASSRSRTSCCARASRRSRSSSSIVSHEVRTPLASVLGFTSLLLNRDVDDETRRRYLEIIDAQGRRLSALLDDFLDVQRLEEGRLELGAERRRHGARCCASRCSSSRRRASCTRWSCACRAAARRARRLEPARAGRRQPALERDQVLAGGRHRRTSAASARTASVRVVVADEGLGIPDAQQERIFTKFYPWRCRHERDRRQRPRARVRPGGRRGARRQDGLHERRGRGLDVLPRAADSAGVKWEGSERPTRKEGHVFRIGVTGIALLRALVLAARLVRHSRRPRPGRRRSASPGSRPNYRRASTSAARAAAPATRRSCARRSSTVASRRQGDRPALAHLHVHDRPRARLPRHVLPAEGQASSSAARSRSGRSTSSRSLGGTGLYDNAPRHGHVDADQRKSPRREFLLFRLVG